MSNSPPNVVGHSLNGTVYRITKEENASLCASIGIEPSFDGSAHPIFSYIATQVGMGETVEGLCAICDFDVADGPMLGGCDVIFHEPLKTESTYTVTGEIISLNRKHSRKLGAMDLLEYRLTLVNAGGHEVVTATINWILPRGNSNDICSQ
jgi:hypothetical protein